jgi:hypothetical protein
MTDFAEAARQHFKRVQEAQKDKLGPAEYSRRQSERSRGNPGNRTRGENRKGGWPKGKPRKPRKLKPE